MSPDQLKSRRDGTIMKTKDQIVKEYDESFLPWPLKPLIKLDYCWRINALMLKHSFMLACPITAIHFLYKYPESWKMTYKTIPKLLITLNYIACVLLINGVNATYSVMFEDYW